MHATCSKDVDTRISCFEGSGFDFLFAGRNLDVDFIELTMMVVGSRFGRCNVCEQYNACLLLSGCPCVGFAIPSNGGDE